MVCLRNISINTLYDDDDDDDDSRSASHCTPTHGLFFSLLIVILVSILRQSMRFKMDNNVHAQILLLALFPLSVSSHRYSILTIFALFLAEDEGSRAWESSNNAVLSRKSGVLERETLLVCTSLQSASITFTSHTVWTLLAEIWDKELG
jgi:hypothetical protein